MKLNFFFTRFDFHNRGGINVIIDVLRASSTIIFLLEKGCSSIIPVNTVKEAFLKKRDKSYITCGEREGKKIKGFDLGNSPSEILNKNIKNKKVVITSSNGIKTLLKCYSEPFTVILGFQNVHVVSEFLKKRLQKINIICAGGHKLPAVEDTLCGGELIHFLRKENEYILNDGAFMSESLYVYHKRNIKKIIKHSNHALHLKEIGYNKDIDLCLQHNSTRIIPIYSHGKIKILTGKL